MRAPFIGLLLLLGTALPTYAQTEDVLAVIHDRAAAHGISGAYLEGIARCESRFNRMAIGSLGERGPFQLLPGGELRTFYARGYTDPHDWWESADFTAARIAEGGARAWTCAR